MAKENAGKIRDEDTIHGSPVHMFNWERRIYLQIFCNSGHSFFRCLLTILEWWVPIGLVHQKKKKNLDLKVKYVIETKRKFPEKNKKNKSLNPPSKDKV